MGVYNIYMPCLDYWGFINGLTKLSTTMFHMSLGMNIILHFEYITGT